MMMMMMMMMLINQLHQNIEILHWMADGISKKKKRHYKITNHWKLVSKILLEIIDNIT